MKNPAAGAFRALSIFNFRVWSAGAPVSNIGTWMQRVAQDWLVLTQLTHHNASMWESSWRCSLHRTFFCCPGPDLPQIISTNASS
jgi:hypothetical protein